MSLVEVTRRAGAQSAGGQSAGFPTARLRRLRRTEALRRFARETELSVQDFVFPLFVTHGQNVQAEISSMPGNYQWSVDRVVFEAEEVARLGIPAVLLFGLPEHKDPVGSGGYDEDGVIPRALRAIRAAVPELILISDVCFCEYTDHGHCGVLDANGYVENDATLELLAWEALAHARAGADLVAPSDMMDGRVGAIREALDGAGYELTPIMAYSAKFASGFYGPFREAADCAPQFGDRRQYQMDPGNGREALREMQLDLAEGADLLMVKPALPYLDVLRSARERFDHPVGAYNVSGEFAMVKAAAQNGWIDEARVTEEILMSIKRAGADFIITYHAKDAARWLRAGS